MAAMNGDQFEGQMSLFDVEPYTMPEPKMDYDPEAWLGRPDIVYHSSFEQSFGSRQAGGNYGEGFHAGTAKAAMERGHFTSPSWISPDDHSFMGRKFLHPLRISGEMALRSEAHEPQPYRRSAPGESDESVARNERFREGLGEHPLAFSDFEVQSNYRPEGLRAESMFGQGLTLPYVNAAEDTGSVSFRAPRRNLSTWAEDVLADPGASRHHKLLAEQFDLTYPAAENAQTQLRRGFWKVHDGGPTGQSGEVTIQESLKVEGDTRARMRFTGKSPLPVTRPQLLHREREAHREERMRQEETRKQIGEGYTW